MDQAVTVLMDFRKQFVIGAFLAAIIGWVAYMIADNAPPYEFDGLASVIVPPKAYGGDQITVRWKIKRINRVCPGTTERILFDPNTKIIIANYDKTSAAAEESLKDGYLNRTFALPRELPAGPIAYRANICYQCNAFQAFIRPMCKTTPTLLFEVQNPTKERQ